MDFEYIKKQGPLVALLLLISWLLYNKIERLESQVQACNDEKFETVVKLTQTSNQALDQNSHAMDRNTEVLESMQAYLGLGSTIHQKRKINPLPARPGIGKQ